MNVTRPCWTQRCFREGLGAFRQQANTWTKISVAIWYYWVKMSKLTEAWIKWPMFYDIFMYTSWMEMFTLSPRLVPKDPIKNRSSLIKIIAWRRIDAKPLPESMMNEFTDAYMRHKASTSEDITVYHCAMLTSRSARLPLEALVIHNMLLANLVRNEYVIITSKHRFDVIITYLLRTMFVGLWVGLHCMPTNKNGYQMTWSVLNFNYHLI